MKSVDLDKAVNSTLNQLLDETICRQLRIELHNLSVYLVDILLKEDLCDKVDECNQRVTILKEEIIKRNIAKGLVIDELSKGE